MPQFFQTAAEFRDWLETHHARGRELVVGFHKKDSGRPSITWPEAVDEALCVGWIDGVRRRIDEHSYQIRFTPRKPGGIWSAVNIRRVEVLSREGRMREAGLRAFAGRSEAKSRIYSYEQKTAATLAEADERCFRREAAAWKYFMAQAPSYRQKVIWRIISAKQAPTRVKRLELLMEYSRQGKRWD